MDLSAGKTRRGVSVRSAGINCLNIFTRLFFFFFLWCSLAGFWDSFPLGQTCFMLLLIRSESTVRFPPVALWVAVGGCIC